MSEKKEGKVKAAPVAKAKKAKVDPASKVKRNADGTKVMKVARGTERARRREGLKRDWKTHPNLPQMKPAANQAEPAKQAV